MSNGMVLALALAIVPVAYFVIYRWIALPLIRLAERKVETPWLRTLLTKPVGRSSVSADLNQRYRPEACRPPAGRPRP